MTEITNNTDIANHIKLGVLSYALALRLRTVGGDALVGVQTEGDMVLQGYRITSVGQLRDNTDDQPAKTIVVDKSLPYMPAIFDFGLYSGTGNLD